MESKMAHLRTSKTMIYSFGMLYLLVSSSAFATTQKRTECPCQKLLEFLSFHKDIKKKSLKDDFSASILGSDHQKILRIFENDSKKPNPTLLVSTDIQRASGLSPPQIL